MLEGEESNQEFVEKPKGGFLSGWLIYLIIVLGVFFIISLVINSTSAVSVSNVNWSIYCSPDVSFIRSFPFDASCEFTNNQVITRVVDIGLAFPNQTNFTDFSQYVILNKGYTAELLGCQDCIKKNVSINWTEQFYNSTKFKEKYVSKLNNTWHYYDDKSTFLPLETKTFRFRFNPFSLTNYKQVSNGNLKYDAFIGNITAKTYELYLDPTVNTTFLTSNFSLDNLTQTNQILEWNNMTSQANYTHDIVLHLTFDQPTSTLKDHTPYNNLINSVTGSPAVIAGKYGNAYNWTGSSTSGSVRLNKTNGLTTIGQASKGFSICGWAKRHSNLIQTDDGDFLFFTTGNTGGVVSDAFVMRLPINNNTLRIQTINGTVVENTFAKSNITTTNWLHICGIWDSTGRILAVINGTVEGNTSWANYGQAYNDSSSTINFGDSTGSNNWNGSMDDWIIWNRTITIAEVNTIYNKGLPYHLGYTFANGTFTSAGININWTAFNITNITAQGTYALNVTCRGTQYNLVNFSQSYACGIANTVFNYTIDFSSATTFFNELNVSGDINSAVPTVASFVVNQSQIRFQNWLTLSANISDDVNLSHYWFENNNTGSFVNTSITSVFGNLSRIVNLTLDLNRTRGQNFAWRVYVNDSENQLTTGTLQNFTVSNSNGTLIIVSPTSVLFFNNSNLTVRFNFTDADLDVGNCNLSINGSVNASNSSVPSGGIASLKSNLSVQSDYLWSVSCSENGAVNVSINRTFVFDFGVPNVFGHSKDKTTINANEVIKLRVSANDSFSVDKLFVEVKNPAGVSANYTGSLDTGVNFSVGSVGNLSGAYNVSFDSTSTTGIYTVTSWFVNDSAGNANSLSVNDAFEVLSGGGGGSGQSFISLGSGLNQTSFSIFTELGGSVLELFVSGDEVREKKVLLRNSEDLASQVSLSCENVGSVDVCSWVSIKPLLINLPASKVEVVEAVVSVTPPKDVVKGDYLFNVVGSNINATHKVNVRLKVGAASSLFGFFSKLGDSITFNSPKIGLQNLKVPVLVFFLLGLAVFIPLLIGIMRSLNVGKFELLISVVVGLLLSVLMVVLI